MVEKIQIAHIPDDLPIYVACYKDVQNASFLKQQLLAGNQVYNYAFVDATTILSRQHLLAAAFRALNDHIHDRLKSNNVHSEIVVCLSSNNNIGDAFRRFGIQDSTKDLVIVKVGLSPEFASESVEGHLKDAIEGTPVPFDDAFLRQTCDLDKLRKTYKLGKPQQGKTVMNGNGGHATDERSDIEVQVLGLMALRGAT
ncbi:hypothetical protein H2198_003265 [Neophaeococcomyces mojaviensis]|uniref:Uncharacterized protein n=1 Tax=Neophaeococcomyces mojaviensis TaxID=3383035 RepID=A0ACC3ABP9_9EURO|nr:hypothetical protein H2198_003265 [Knufia sp. JES_112]